MWILLLVPLLFLLPYLGCYLLSPASSYSDLLISHLPNAIYLRQALAQYHQIPLWSATILSGYPFAANPLSGLWYPPGWLAILIPEPWGFNIAILIHLLWGGAGVYLLLKKEGVSGLGAAVGGMLFAALPKTIAHIGAGHITLVYAVSWTPWLLLAEATKADRQGQRRFAFFPALALGAVILADVRWAIPVGLLWVAYAIRRRWPSWLLDRRWQVKALFRDGIDFGGQAVLAGMIAAPLWIPLFRYTQLSTRVTMAASDATVYSLPISRLLGLFFPSFGGNAEWTLYLGGIPTALLLVSCLDRSQWKKYAFWWAVFAISLLLSMGENLPVVRGFYLLPGMRLLRVPPRFLFLTGMSAAVILGLVVDRLRTAVAEHDPLKRPMASLTLAGFGFLLLLFSFGLWAFSPEKSWSSLLGGGMVMLGAIFVILRIKAVLPWKPAAILLVGLLVVDLTIANWMDLRPERDLPETTDVQAVLSRLSEDNSLFRVYSPSYSLPQEQAARHGIQLADGVDPLQLSGYRAFMDQASGVPSSGYSVTLPTYADADPEIDNAAYLPNARLLGWLNVKYLVSGFPLSGDDLELLGKYGNTYLYLNQAALPRAWMQIGSLPDTAIDRTVKSMAWTPNHIQVAADGPGELVLSEVYYPGWTVRVDGQPARLDQVDKVLRGVALPGGVHQVTFDYSPVDVYLGLAVAGLGWLLLLTTGLFPRHSGEQ